MFSENTVEPYCVWEHKCFKHLSLHNSSSCALCVHMSAYVFFMAFWREKYFIESHYDCLFCFQVDHACRTGKNP